MATNLTARGIILGLSETTPVPTLVDRCQTVHDSMAVHLTLFPSPNPTLPVFQTGIDALSTAQAAFKGRTGSKAARDTAKAALLTMAHQEHAYVVQLATADPSQAAELATAAAMTFRKQTHPQKSDLAVKPSTSGAVHVIAKRTKGAKASEWQYSTDGGKTWIATAATTQSRTLITGLQPGTTVQYRHRAILKTGPTDWTGPISAVVT